MDQVTFQIKFEAVGGNIPDVLRKQLEGLATQVSETTKKATTMTEQFFKFNQIAQGIQNVTSAISQISSTVGSYTKYSQNQAAAETRLAAVMRNTMKASDDEIQSIKDLASAQQKLGVIGDEVQLAGAQELATYMNKADSLKKLIPVLNDMVAQQYGYNASAESAVSIATMMGKVFEGQTSALSRYGYSFSEAEEKVLKFGTEEQKAATLATVVSRSVGGVNAELAKTDAGKMIQTANAIGDVKERLGAALQPLQAFITTAAEIGMAAGGFTQLAVAIAPAASGLVHFIKNLNMAAISTAAMTVKQWALNVAMNANPIGIIITAIGALVAGLVLLYRNCEPIREALNQLWEAFKSLYPIINLVKTRFLELFAVISDSIIGDALKLLGKLIINNIVMQLKAAAAALKLVTVLLRRLFGIKDTTTADSINDINDETADATDLTEQWAAALKKLEAEQKTAAKSKKDLVAGQYGFEEQELQKLRKNLAEADKESAQAIYNRIDLLEKAIQKRKKELEAAAALANADTSNMNKPITAPILTGQDKEALEITVKTDLEQALKELKEFQEREEIAFSERTEKRIADQKKAVNELTSSFANLGNAIGGAAGGWLTWAANLAQAIAQAIPSIMALVAAKKVESSANAKAAVTGAASSTASIPYVGAALAVAAVAAVVAAMISVPKFASGGLAYGPTVGMFGEYQGARSNPEVIAPLSKLRDLISESGADGQVRFFISGRDLEGVLSKRLNYNNRT